MIAATWYTTRGLQSKRDATSLPIDYPIYATCKPLPSTVRTYLSTSPSIILSVHLPSTNQTYLPICLPTSQTTYLSAFPSNSQHLNLPINKTANFPSFRTTRQLPNQSAHQSSNQTPNLLTNHSPIHIQPNWPTDHPWHFRIRAV